MDLIFDSTSPINKLLSNNLHSVDRYKLNCNCVQLFNNQNQQKNHQFNCFDVFSDIFQYITQGKLPFSEPPTQLYVLTQQLNGPKAIERDTYTNRIRTITAVGKVDFARLGIVKNFVSEIVEFFEQGEVGFFRLMNTYSCKNTNN